MPEPGTEAPAPHPRDSAFDVEAPKAAKTRKPKAKAPAPEPAPVGSGAQGVAHIKATQNKFSVAPGVDPVLVALLLCEVSAYDYECFEHYRGAEPQPVG